MLVGASSLAAPGLAEQDNPVRKLERLLRKRRRNVEVVNAGVEGYYAIQSATALPEWLRAYSPTHVFVVAGTTAAVMYDQLLSFNTVWRGTHPVFVMDVALRLANENSHFRDWVFQDTRRMAAARGIFFSGFRFGVSIDCGFLKISGLGRSECFFRPTFRAVKSMWENSNLAGAEFHLLLPEGEVKNSLLIPPNYRQVVSFLAIAFLLLLRRKRP
ncbi:MAG: hypothetical protein HUU37_10685, partial [Bdellovibrionales bacterium]|nr:hypothetical protein [Bdellovibrionales bacterium]